MTNPETSSTITADEQAAYGRVLATFLRNSLVREMSFRSNFLLTVITRGFWFGAQLILFDIIYRNVREIDDWSRPEYFGFMATSMLINAIVEAVFMPNCANFSELIRTGNLDFALLKPIDTQFLVSFEKIDVAMIAQFGLAGALLSYAIIETGVTVGPVEVLLYLMLVASAVAFFYSLMISLASTSVMFGRNQGLLDFWFYVTVFARYPAGIYSGSPAGELIRVLFSYGIPILLVVTVPARVLLSKTLEPNWIIGFTVASALFSLAVSRAIFRWSLRYYRSASS